MDLYWSQIKYNQSGMQVYQTQQFNTSMEPLHL